MFQKISNLPKSLIAIMLFLEWIQVGCSNNSKETQNCTLTVAQAPEIGTFRLGISLDDLRKRFPEFQIASPDVFLTTKIILRSSLNPSVGDKSASAPSKNDYNFTVSVDKHPEFRDIEEAALMFYEERLFRIEIYYSNKPEWQTYDAFVNDMARKLNLPFNFKKHDTQPKMSVVSCGSEHDAGFELDAGFKEHNGSERPYTSLIDLARFVAFSKNLDKVKAEISRSENAKPTPSQTGVTTSTPQNVTQVEIAGLSVSVGQDAYISQDRLESYLVKTEGNTDTYSYGGKTYEITYGPGERGAYFVKAIRILK